MRRLQGWESRLAAVIEHARAAPYCLGTHDCFRVACQAVEALTGVDLWRAWAGRYATRQESIRLMAEYAGDFTACFTKLFEIAPAHVAQARRGDILEYVAGDPHLGVCVGERVAVLGERGLAFVPLAACRHVWRIG